VPTPLAAHRVNFTGREVMGIPNSAFRVGDLYIEYVFEEVLFRYEYESEQFFCKFYSDTEEHRRNHDNRLLNDAILSGVLTTAAALTPMVVIYWSTSASTLTPELLLIFACWPAAAVESSRPM